MIFKKLELKNWIAFQEADINFSTKKNKNITLIRGNNKGGKTAILRAIRWALYGNTGDIDIYIKNHYKFLIVSHTIMVASIYRYHWKFVMEIPTLRLLDL